MKVARTVAEISRLLADIDHDLRVIRDPWCRRELARRRRHLNDELEVARLLAAEDFALRLDDIDLDGLFYVTRFPNNRGICTLQRATSPTKARSLAEDPYYGRPEYARPATREDVAHVLGMGGVVN